VSDACVIENQRAGRDASHQSVVGSERVIAPLSCTLWRCDPVSAVGTAREDMDGAGDGFQRSLVSRFRFQPRLRPGVRVRPLTVQQIVLEENYTWTTV